MTARSCATCAHWDLKNAYKTPTGRLTKDSAARCFWKPVIVLPASMRGYHAPVFSASAMRPKEGTDCECWKER